MSVCAKAFLRGFRRASDGPDCLDFQQRDKAPLVSNSLEGCTTSELTDNLLHLECIVGGSVGDCVVVDAVGDCVVGDSVATAWATVLLAARLVSASLAPP